METETEMVTDTDMERETTLAETGPPALFHWKIVLELIQAAFQEGHMVE